MVLFISVVSIMSYQNPLQDLFKINEPQKNQN